MKKKPKFAEELSKDSSQLYDNLNEGSDLSVAILGPSYINECLGSLLSGKLISGDTSVELLNPNTGPIGNLFSRTRFAYCLGLINKKTYQDLLLILEIRNKFAHSYFKIDFSNQDIINKCKKFGVATEILDAASKDNDKYKDYATYSRNVFLLSVVLISNRIILDTLALQSSKNTKS